MSTTLTIPVEQSEDSCKRSIDHSLNHSDVIEARAFRSGLYLFTGDEPVPWAER